MLQITVTHGGALYIPEPAGQAVWETDLRAPGRFVFSVPESLLMPLEEGDAVSAASGEDTVFAGFVFTLRSGQDGLVTVTAYDQTRYLKNRDVCSYDGVTASALLRRIAADHGLRLGEVADTKVLLEPRAEDNKTLADILKNALEATEEAGGERFILFDRAGALTLKSAAQMRLDLLLDSEGAQTYTLTSSIDGGTYNTVKLTCEKKTGRTVHTAADAGNVAKWGKLQYYQKIADDFNGREKAQALLKLRNRAREELFAGGVIGDVRVRAGCSLACGLGGGTARMYTVERARHLWRDGGYFMDLTLNRSDSP